MQLGLYDTNVDFHDDLTRNIPGVRRAQDLFDDLSDDASDWEIAIAAESAGRLSTPAALITRPFDYGTVVSYSFDSAHWIESRFSDGRSYGVWCGSMDLETTVYETAWHWSRFVRDSYADEDREIVTDRRVFDVRCDAVLIDLRGKESAYPDLLSRTSYAFTQRVGGYMHEQGLNGLLVRSARCDGSNAAIMKAERLSNVRDRMFLTYRFNSTRDELLAERTPGEIWLRLRPSSLG